MYKILSILFSLILVANLITVALFIIDSNSEEKYKECYNEGISYGLDKWDARERCELLKELPHTCKLDKNSQQCKNDKIYNKCILAQIMKKIYSRKRKTICNNLQYSGEIYKYFR